MPIRVRNQAVPLAGGHLYRSADPDLEAIGVTTGIREICGPPLTQLAVPPHTHITPAAFFKMLVIVRRNSTRLVRPALFTQHLVQLRVEGSQNTIPP